MVRALVSLCLAALLAACATATPQPSDKRIALTFDDVPRSAGPFLTVTERASRLVEGLEEAGVEQAAFFINPGFFADRPKGMAHAITYREYGHVLANHSATHPRLSASPVEDYLADIDRAELWLGTMRGRRFWFRYPYLDEGRDDPAKRDAIRAGLAERGLSNGYVTVDASDWFYEGAAKEAVARGNEIDMDALRDLYVESHVEAAEFYDELARRAIGRSPAHVMLLHETDLAALYIVDLVRALEAEGWTIVTADEAYADPFAAYAANYDTPSAQGTLTEQVAWQAGIPAPRWYARNNVDLARAEFDRRVLHREPEGAE